MITFDNVTFAYGDNPPVLAGLSFPVRRGELAALVGANGAGKTTILKHLNGLLRPVRGRVLVAGLDTAACPVSRLARRVGFLFQNPDHQIFLPLVEREIAYGPANLGLGGEQLAERVREAARLTGLAGLLDRDPRALGWGLRQRVALAAVLAMRPEILVLDEPTTGQDEAEAEQIMAAVADARRAGTTVLLVSHDMELVAAHAERVLVLARGRLLLDGPPEKVFAAGDALAEAGLRAPLSLRLRRLGFAGGFDAGLRAEEAV